MIKKWTFSAILLLAFIFSMGCSWAYCINDTVLGNYQGKAFVVLPLDFSSPREMSLVFGTFYSRDVGWTLQTRQTGGFMLKRVTVKQISITPGLIGGAYFGGPNPGSLTLTEQNPHLHTDWTVQSPGTYVFEFQLVDALDANGMPIADSPVLLLVFTAGRTHAEVSIRAAHRLPDGAKVEITGLHVSSAGHFAYRAYAQQTDRAAGIGLFISPGSLSVGDTCTVRGSMSSESGERFVSVTSIIGRESGDPPRPLFMKLNNLGGSGEVLHTPEIGGDYLRNTGLLVTVAGKLREDVFGRAFIDDGSTPQGVMISLDDTSPGNAISIPSSGFAVVTGISDAGEDDWGVFGRVVRPRTQGDIVLR